MTLGLNIVRLEHEQQPKQTAKPWLLNIAPANIVDKIGWDQFQPL